MIELVGIARYLTAAASVMVLSLRSLPPACYFKDLHVVYVTARALREGIYVLTPAAELAARYFPVTVSLSAYPNHLPPLLSLLSVPLSILPFPVVAFLWLCANMILLVLIGRMLGLSVVSSAALSAWPPAFWVLDNGNFEILILALAMKAWKEARLDREWRAGLLLGVAAVIKFYPALFVLPFLVRRRLRLVAAAGLTFGLGQLGNLVAVGPQGLRTYYFDILPTGANLWIDLGLNSSPYGMLLRLFGGARDVEPLIHAPWLVLPITILFSAVALVALLRLEPEASPLAVLVGMPNVRGYFAVLALPQIVSLLRKHDLRRGSLVTALSVSFALPLVNATLNLIGRLISLTPASHSVVACLLACIQTAGFVALVTVSLIISIRSEKGHPV